MIEEKDLIESGKILKPHGLKGELNVMMDYNAEILLEDYPLIIEIDGIFVPFYAESVRPKGHFASLVKIQGVDTVENAKEFVNKIIFLRKKDVAEYLQIEEDELVTEDDYIGWKVYDSKQDYIGRVEELDCSTENMLLIVRPDCDENEENNLIYIPFNHDFITEVQQDIDPNECELHLDLPEGLIDLNK